MADIEVVLKAGTPTLIEAAEEMLAPVRLDHDAKATVFAMNDEWHVYDVQGVLHFVPANEDR